MPPASTLKSGGMLPFAQHDSRLVILSASEGSLTIDLVSRPSASPLMSGGMLPFAQYDNRPTCPSFISTIINPMRERIFYVYIMTNQSRTLYTGVTNDIYRRVSEHKNKTIAGFTSKYNINKLVYYEECPDPYTAIEREKQIKGWLRIKKINLIESENPNWHDLSKDWYSAS